MNKILYLIALLHKAYTNAAERPASPRTPSIQHATTLSPLPLAAYGLVRDILQPRPNLAHFAHHSPHAATGDLLKLCAPLVNLYRIAKKYPTAYPLLSSTDFVALQETPLQEGDTIVVKRSPVENDSGASLFFNIIAPPHTVHPDPKNPTTHDVHVLSAGTIAVLSWSQHPAELASFPTIESYNKIVEERD